MPTPSPDAKSFGEDLVGNLRDAVRISRRYCTDCADYHVICLAGRLAGRRARTEPVDRDLIVDTLRGLLTGRTGADVLIAGSSDSGLLSWATEAAHLAAPGGAGGTRFTLIDRCGTPLEWCRRFAVRHGLSLATRTVEVGTAAAIGSAADVILVHSLFRFVQRERHVAGLEQLAAALKPGGRIVFSQSIGLGSTPILNRARLRELIDTGAIVLPEPEPDFMERLARREAPGGKAPSDYEDEAAFTALFAAAGLRTVERRLLSRPDGSRSRLLAVLATGQ